MWEELATAENLDAKLWPRLAAIAERFWSPAIGHRCGFHVSAVGSDKPVARVARVDPAFQPRIDAATSGWQHAVPAARPLGIHSGAGKRLLRVTPNDTRSSTPLNRLVDSIPPESDAARDFRDAVDRYLAAKDQRRGRCAAEVAY